MTDQLLVAVGMPLLMLAIAVGVGVWARSSARRSQQREALQSVGARDKLGQKT
jgi:hypothetical protein